MVTRKAPPLPFLPADAHGEGRAWHQARQRSPGWNLRIGGTRYPGAAGRWTLSKISPIEFETRYAGLAMCPYERGKRTHHQLKEYT